MDNNPIRNWLFQSRITNFDIENINFPNTENIFVPLWEERKYSRSAYERKRGAATRERAASDGDPCPGYGETFWQKCDERRRCIFHRPSWLRIPLLRVSPSLSRRSLLSCVRREARLKGPRSVLKTRDICDIHPMLPTGTYVLLVYPRAGRGYEADFYTCSPTLHRGE